MKAYGVVDCDGKPEIQSVDVVRVADKQVRLADRIEAFGFYLTISPSQFDQTPVDASRRWLALKNSQVRSLENRLEMARQSVEKAERLLERTILREST